jgi:hypothetical protein
MSRNPGTLRSRLAPSAAHFSLGFARPSRRLAAVFYVVHATFHRDVLRASSAARGSLRALSLLVFALAVTFPRLAHAQSDPVPSLDLRNFYPPLDPDSSLNLESSATPGPGNWNVGVWASYALSPITLGGPGGETLATVIKHQFSVDYFVGLGIGERLGLGLTLPTVVYQTGDNVSGLIPGASDLPPAAVGDLSVAAKATLFAPGDLGGFGLAALGRVFAPTGNQRSYIGDGSVRGELRLLSELQLLALVFRATAGARVRGQERTLLDDGTDDFQFGNELPWGAGLTFRPQILGIDRLGRWRWTVEARGSVALTPTFAAGPQSPAIIGASARYTVDEISGIAGVEFPLNDAIGNPMVRPVLGLSWAPRFEDADKDGIEDADDECPELAEDRDGFEDTDGCPDFDDDDDGVPDESDRCPKEKEDVDEFQDEDGCPDPDNDGDGVLDAADACPNQVGIVGGAKPGCPPGDTDHDGITDDKDRCPKAPEDRDQFEDEDGCPDPDNDHDRIRDKDDMCPNVAGQSRPDTDLHGCPSPDKDGDSYDDAEDKCPAEPEDFDGVDDQDGCPDADAAGAPPSKPLVAVVEKAGEKALELRVPIRFKDADIAPESVPTLRAIAELLNQHEDWIVAVGTKPTKNTAVAEQDALKRA